MALPNRIELKGGFNRPWEWFVWSVWFLALASFSLQAQRIPELLWLPGVALLLWSLPRPAMFARQRCRLVLYADGKAHWDAERGAWSANTFRTRWFTVIEFRGTRASRHLWICRSRNHTDDYRHLGIWCRFPPHSPDFR